MNVRQKLAQVHVFQFLDPLHQFCRDRCKAASQVEGLRSPSPVFGGRLTLSVGVMAAVAATRLLLLGVCDALAEAPMRLIAAMAGGIMPVVREEPVSIGCLRHNARLAA